MLIYIFLLLLLICLLHLILNRRLLIRSENILLNVMFFIMFFLIVFRSEEVGTDYQNHLESFLSKKDFSFLPDDLFPLFFSEPIWNSSLSIINQINVPFHYFWILYFIILWYFLMKAVPLNDSRMFVCLIFILSYFFYASFNTSAQILSSLIILCAIKEVNDKRTILGGLLLLLAFLIHKSTLFVIPFISLNYVKIKKKIYYWLFIISFIIIILGLDSYLFQELNMYLTFSDNITNMEDYNKYLDMNDNKLNLMGKIMHYFILIANVILFILFHKRNEHNLDIYSHLWALGIIISIMTINYEWLFRLSYCFLMSMIIAIPKLCYKKEEKRYRSSVFMSLAFSLLVLIYICKLYNNADGIVPYQLLVFGR